MKMRGEEKNKRRNVWKLFLYGSVWNNKDLYGIV